MEPASCGGHETDFTASNRKAFLGKLLRYLNSSFGSHELKVNVIGRAWLESGDTRKRTNASHLSPWLKGLYILFTAHAGRWGGCVRRNDPPLWILRACAGTDDMQGKWQACRRNKQSFQCFERLTISCVYESPLQDFKCVCMKGTGCFFFTEIHLNLFPCSSHN